MLLWYWHNWKWNNSIKEGYKPINYSIRCRMKWMLFEVTVKCNKNVVQHRNLLKTWSSEITHTSYTQMLQSDTKLLIRKTIYGWILPSAVSLCKGLASNTTLRFVKDIVHLLSVISYHLVGFILSFLYQGICKYFYGLDRWESLARITFLLGF